MFLHEYCLACELYTVRTPAFNPKNNHMVGRGSQPGHTKDHNKNCTNCLPAWHAMR